MPAARLPRNLVAALRHDLLVSLLAVVSVGIGLYELGRPRPDRAFTPLDAVDLGIVVAFLVDFVVRARRSGDWRRYVRERWWELPSLVPVTGGMVEGLDGVALVRGVRLFRLVRAVRIARVLATTPRFRRTGRYVRRVVRRSKAGAISLVAAVVVGLGGAALFAAESRANEAVATFPDAAWWSLRAFLGGAFQPATTAGRVVSAVLQVTGIALLGIFTASMANAIIKEPEPEEDVA